MSTAVYGVAAVDEVDNVDSYSKSSLVTGRTCAFSYRLSLVVVRS